MIHYVIEEVDAGACITSKEIPMKGVKSLEDLETRIHEQEWVLIVEGTRMAIENLKKDCS